MSLKKQKQLHFRTLNNDKYLPTLICEFAVYLLINEIIYNLI